MSMEIDPRIMARYEQLMHAMQSGVATLEGMAANGQCRAAELEPKHLRCGVNSAFQDRRPVVLRPRRYAHAPEEGNRKCGEHERSSAQRGG